MTSDFQRVQLIHSIASGKTAGNEPTFTFPEVAEVVRQCTENQIAVLGVEVFEILPTGYSTKNLSNYDQQIGAGPRDKSAWADYVRKNNILAQEFIKLHPAGDDHVYVLTTASWREFQQICTK